jgi:predicted amidohydrolase
MKNETRVACAQTHPAETREETVKKFMDICKDNSRCSMIVFPELYFPEVDHELLERIRAFAAECRLTLVFGGIEKEDGKVYDTAWLVEYDRICKYRKTHVHWTEDYEQGSELPVFDTSIGKVGLLVCYDSTFIETSRILALKGAEIIVILAAVPARFDVKISLCRIQANAMENQVFIIYVNKPIDDQCNGNSMIVNPKGRTIACAGSVEVVITGQMHGQDLIQWRQEERIFPFRRPELYSLLSKRQEREFDAASGNVEPSQ